MQQTDWWDTEQTRNNSQPTCEKRLSVPVVSEILDIQGMSFSEEQSGNSSSDYVEIVHKNNLSVEDVLNKRIILHWTQTGWKGFYAGKVISYVEKDESFLVKYDISDNDKQSEFYHCLLGRNQDINWEFEKEKVQKKRRKKKTKEKE